MRGSAEDMATMLSMETAHGLWTQQAGVQRFIIYLLKFDVGRGHSSASVRLYLSPVCLAKRLFDQSGAVAVRKSSWTADDGHKLLI